MSPEDRTPYVGAGAEGARRSAAIDREERDLLSRTDFERWASLTASASRWDAQADRLEGISRLNCQECRGRDDHKLDCSRRSS